MLQIVSLAPKKALAYRLSAFTISSYFLQKVRDILDVNVWTGERATSSHMPANTISTFSLKNPRVQSR